MSLLGHKNIKRNMTGAKPSSISGSSKRKAKSTTRGGLNPYMTPTALVGGGFGQSNSLIDDARSIEHEVDALIKAQETKS